MRTPRAPHLIDAVERIYADVETATAHGWLGATMDALQSLGLGSRGGFAYAYDITGDEASWRISRPIVHGMPEEVADAIQASFATAPPAYRASLQRLGPCGTLAAGVGVRLRDLPGPGARAAQAIDAMDALYVNAVDPTHTGVFFGFAVERERRLHVTERRRLGMIAAHVASARRLLVTERREPVAVFERSGALAHVDRDHEGALDTLKAQMSTLSQLERPSSDPDFVLARWTALVAGRYSLIRRFDSDGRRHVLAYENPPNVADPRGLTQQEAAIANLVLHGHAQKLIAYELGLSLGTVGGLLARVFQKLRVRSTVALVERLRVPVQVERSIRAGRELLLFSSSSSSSSSPSLEATHDAASLTPAERAVVLAAARGATNEQIAQARSTSASTVQHQLTSAYRKLGVASRSELVTRLHWPPGGASSPLAILQGKRPSTSRKRL